ncbi:MAG: cyclic nucleotide-binding domain-containing protein [Rhodospirillales bacterium]|nr:cyclic nucleotide-binding domain-containing protein [Rhodospirillales bacterium]MBO6787281.1 cyclic nucleotide-binding domain-containing protein [Rhodospirillales bacterium]
MSESQVEQTPQDDDNEEIELEYRSYSSGQIIFKQGDMGNEAYFVDTGKVEIARGDGTAETVLGVVGKGELLGEMALVDAEERMATARAMGKTTLIVVPKKVFARVLKKSNPIVVAMMHTLLRRLRVEGGATAKKTLG